MADVIITSHSKDDNYDYIEMVQGKKAAFVSFDKRRNCINVICKNASHRVFRGAGRHFYNGWDEAIAGYKSSQMKTMIKVAQQLVVYGLE